MSHQNVDFRNNYHNHYAEVMQSNVGISFVQWHLSNASPKPPVEFTLNTSSFVENPQLNNTKKIHTSVEPSSNGYINIHAVIQVILAKEKHKVTRQEVTEGTYRMTKVRLETHIAAFFDHTDLRTVNMGSIQRFIDYLSDQELSTPTIVGYIAQLRKVLRYLVEHEHIAQMPLFPKMKVTQKPRGAFTVTEYAAMLRQSKTLRRHEFVWDKPDTRFHIKPQYRRMPFEMNGLIRFMVYTFLRPGDVRQLKNKHIEIIHGKFHYLRLTPPEIKRHKAPTVSLPQAVRVYKTLLAHQTAMGYGKPDDYVFFPEEKNRLRCLNTIGWLFNWILNSLGIKAGPHGADRSFYSLRHTAITFRLIFGGNIDLLTLARNARTSVEMIEKFYASTLSAEMNISLLHSKRRN